MGSKPSMRDSYLKEQLKSREGKGLLRKMRTLEGCQDRRVVIDGKPVINLCSNNYLGLAQDARVREAAVEAIRRYGIGSGASRLVCGNMAVHQALEEKIAAFKGQEACLVYTSGYCANTGIIPSVVGRDDLVLSDRLNHASIVDGIILSRAKLRRYAHGDTESLEGILNGNRGHGQRMIVTETVFSMDGDIAPLPDIVSVAEKHDCLVMVDEAHATGVLGKNGQGAAGHFGLENRIDIQMGTLSKAIGCQGGYVCGSRTLIDYLINFSRQFIYTTALPPAVAAACIKAIQVIETEPGLRARLWDNVKYLKSGLDSMGFDVKGSQTPIIPLLVKDAAAATNFSLKLLEAGVFIQAIRPPAVPEGQSRLRLTVTAGHEREDLDRALDAIKKTGRQLCLI